MAEAAVAAAMAAGMETTDQAMDDENFSATKALVAFLRMEADLSDEKAKRLRKQASDLARKFGITDRSMQAYEVNPNQLAPLDENGKPKYKGKKRGRKPKERKRKANPNREKRKHTAYTLFVHETYPGVKARNPDLASKEVISIVAKQWRTELSAEEKKQWKSRAQATHHEEEGGSSSNIEEDIAAAAVERVEDDQDDVEDDDDDEEEDEDDGEGEESEIPDAEASDEDEVFPPARRRKRSRK